MKTATKKPAKSANSKTITPTADGESEKLSRPRLLASDAKGRAGQCYWTIKMSAAPPPKDWGVIGVERPPHGMLCTFQFGTLKALVKRLKDFDFTRARMTNLARVRLTGTGFLVDYYPTLADALAAEKEPAGEHCCPFCLKSDMIEEIRWAGERFDGTDFELPALRCNRCDLIAPKVRWVAGGPVHA